jgi:hypothetical protein
MEKAECAGVIGAVRRLFLIDLALTPRKTSSQLSEPAASLEETHNRSR